MKAIDVIRDKGINAVENLAWKAFSAAKDKITSLVRNQRKQQPTGKVGGKTTSAAINDSDALKNQKSNK